MQLRDKVWSVFFGYRNCSASPYQLTPFSPNTVVEFLNRARIRKHVVRMSVTMLINLCHLLCIALMPRDDADRCEREHGALTGEAEITL